VQGKTRVRKNQSSPEWNEQIIFTELFPPLVKRMRIHVRDDSGVVMATAFIDLTHISDNSVNGCSCVNNSCK
jgi:Ca2+-dependent lipid-binding protein